MVFGFVSDDIHAHSFSNQFQPIAASAAGPDFDMIMGMAISTYPHRSPVSQNASLIFPTTEQ
jgi:hypothetical protein